MSYTKYKEEIEKLLKNRRVAKRVKELKPTNEQLAEALPILIDMVDDKEDGIKEYLTSFDITKTGAVIRTQELSKVGEANAYKENIVTLEMQDFNFSKIEDFHKDPERLTLINTLAEYTKDKMPEKGLYIYGSTGIGKTFICKRFAHLLARKGKRVGIINVPQLAIDIKATFGSGSDEMNEWFDLLKKVEFLFLDDMGGEAIASWFRDEFLYPLLSYRAENSLITFINSNFSFNELVKIEAKTSKTKYLETEKATRLVNKVKTLTRAIKLEGKNRNY